MRPIRKGNDRITPAPSRCRSGFTLVELVVAIAIVGILCAIAIPSYSNYRNKARIARAITELQMLETAINAYSMSNNRYPDTLDDIGYGTLLDPWGHAYQYLDIADSGTNEKGDLRKDRFLNPLNSDYDLYSMGADGQSKPPLTASASQDDIVRANNGGFIGLASEF